MAITRRLGKNQIIIFQGEVPRYVYVVIQGFARAYSIDSNGDKKTLDIYGKNDHLPIGATYNRTPISLFYYDTIGKCTLELYTKEEFQVIVQGSRSAEMERLAQRNVVTMMHIDALMKRRAEDKIAFILQYLNLKFGKNMPTKNYRLLDVRLTQNDIAELCGLTRETTALELKKLIDAGVIIRKHKCYILNHKKLFEITEVNEIEGKTQ